MKKLILILSICLFFFAHGHAQAPNWNWAKSGQGAGQDYGNSISTDANGNCYATGYFQVPSVIFGSDTLTGSIAYHDGFYLVKYDNSGNEIWAKYAGDENNAYGTCVNTDANGNSYVSGYFQGTGTIHFGSYNLISPDGGNEEFLAKYDSSGNVLWAKLEGPLAGFSSPSVSNGIDSVGNVYIAGNSDSIGFIKKLDSSGNLIWQKNATGNFRTSSIAADAKGNSYVTGSFMGTTMTFGSYTVSNSSGGQIIFVVKYDSTGNVIWAKSTGTYASLYAPSISADTSGNSYVTGYFNGPYAKFGSTTLTNTGYNSIFVVKFDSSGNIAWAKGGIGSSVLEGHCIKTDATGNSYVTGMFTSIATFGSTNLYSAGANDVFVVKYDSSGNVLWAQSAGGDNLDVGSGITADANGNSYITGYFFTSHIHFGGITLTNSDTISNPAEVFIAKLNNVATGIVEENNLTNSVTIFPNPFSSIATIRIDKELKNATLVVYNILGEELKEIKNISGNTITLNRDNLPSGLYFFRLLQNSKIFTIGKLIVTD